MIRNTPAGMHTLRSVYVIGKSKHYSPFEQQCSRRRRTVIDSGKMMFKSRFSIRQQCLIAALTGRRTVMGSVCFSNAALASTLYLNDDAAPILQLCTCQLVMIAPKMNIFRSYEIGNNNRIFHFCSK